LQHAEFEISPTISDLIPSDSTTICRSRINYLCFREVLESAIDEAKDRLGLGGGGGDDDDDESSRINIDDKPVYFCVSMSESLSELQTGSITTRISVRTNPRTANQALRFNDANYGGSVTFRRFFKRMRRLASPARVSELSPIKRRRLPSAATSYHPSPTNWD
jgi:hypothetical protein